MVADDPGVIAQPFGNAPMPLVHQVSNGRDNERGDGRARHQRERHFGLARSSGHDDAPASRVVPASDSPRLIGAKLSEITFRPKNAAPIGNGVGDLSGD